MSTLNEQLTALSAMINTKANNGIVNDSQTETRVKPTSKRNLPPVEPLSLHAFDLLMPLMNVRLPFVFKIESDGSAGINGSLRSGLRERFDSIAARLTASLAEALELYPPVAGTIVTSPDDASAITIVCNNRGATFMTQIEEREYDESEHLIDGLSGTDSIPVNTSRTLFAVKLTLFSCGTMIMITSIHHYIADLTSYMDFIDAWAQLSRGDDLSMAYSTLSWSRNFNLPVPAAVPATVPGIIKTSSPPTMPALRIGEGIRWFISKSNLARLKRDCMTLVSSGKPSDPWISSADALTALVWGAMTRARHAIPNLVVFKHAESESLTLAVNGRERIPGLEPSEAGGPSRYFGNLNLFLAVYASRPDLMEGSIGGTARVALAIRKTLQDETTPEAIAGRIAFVEAAKKSISIDICDYGSTSWSKYDLASFDFGLGADVKSMGTTLATRTINIIGMIFITRVSEGLIVATIVEKEADELLKVDPILTRYAEALSY